VTCADGRLHSRSEALSGVAVAFERVLDAGEFAGAGELADLDQRVGEVLGAWRS
jgi:hypothetical protein